MRALICGVSGQDGAYLAKYLLDKGYEVIGSSRDAQMSSFNSLKELQIFDEIKKVSLSINDYGNVINLIREYKPDEIYNLAGQSSVGLSFSQPVEAFESISKGTLTILEAIRSLDKRIRFYNAGSSECFGNTNGKAADENTPFNPCSPYGLAKASAHWLVRIYRSSYNLYACSGILFNHESPLRAKRFVTHKIIQSALRISNGKQEKLKLGNINTLRDWGWAPEYIEAMWLILQQESPDDYVIATGKSYTLAEFIDRVFAYFSLNWKDYVEVDSDLIRPTDIDESLANPSYAYKQFGWKAKVTFDEMIFKLCQDAENNFEK